jgi:biotin transport system substrate-specific component
MAQARIVLPWTPVPITLQTMGVLLAGLFLGRNWGGICLALYIMLGIAGVPWFTGWGSGTAYLLGSTGGYLLGFVLAALCVGHFTDTYVSSRRFGRLLLLMCLASFVLIYVPGVIQLKIWMDLVTGTQMSWGQAVNLGVTPFLAGDALKVAAASGLGCLLASHRPFGGEANLG